MMDGAGGGENHGPTRGEGKADHSLAGDFQTGFGIWGYPDDAARSRQRSGDVEITLGIESHALGAAQALEKSRDVSARIDFEDAIIRAGHEKIAVGAEREVVGGNAHFQRGENENLLIARDFKNRPVAVADVEADRKSV